MKYWLPALVALYLSLCPVLSHAWWNQDWTSRKKITLDTSDTGAAIVGAASNVPVLVRLHTGNFTFADADLDGKDLRFVAEDDQTPLKFHIEKFDGSNDLALIWVQVPKLEAKSKTGAIWLYYGNAKAAPAADSKTSYDGGQTIELHFAEADAAFKDSTAFGHTPAGIGVTQTPTGVADGAAVFNGAGKLSWATVPPLKLGVAGLTFSAWVKPADVAQRALLFSQQEGSNAVQLIYDQGKLFARAFGQETGKVDLAAGAWRHVAITLADGLTLLVDGKPVASAVVTAADLGGELVVGDGFKGEIDEVQLSNVARAASWLEAQAASQSASGKLVAVAAAGESSDGGSGTSYFTILLSAVTLDGWIVIGILGVMFVMSVFVMFSKGVFLSRTDSANKAFLERFGCLDRDLTTLDGPDPKSKVRNSSVYRLYSIGVRELRKRFSGGDGTNVNLSAQSIDAIRATLDAGMVRENARINSMMVLLTICIAGGPFLGLLGTVVGVMITFAAIAAAGDVNVNAIAPGIAAALVATVAGLGVAIPALFGYNYLAARAKNISADMQVFADELVTRMAENYSS